MNLKQIHNVYFIGIGGAGMSALARYFVAIGKEVVGYDKYQSQNTAALQDLGVQVHFDDDVSNIPAGFLNRSSTLVVYTPAIPSSHKELSYFFTHEYTVLKRAQVLGIITQSTLCLAVAGTHGKTTTSSMLGHIMQSENATSFLGGVTENYNSNLILGGEAVSVVEADEFDRSFLHLTPNIACITSVDADHLDIYKEHGALLDSFKEFASKVSQTLVVAKGVPLKGLTYAIDESADYVAKNLKVAQGKYIFDVKTPTDDILGIELSLPGRHNVMNALAAIALAEVYGVNLNVVKERLSSFKGVQRRFSYRLNTKEIALIDDYAHHPTEINAVGSAVREMYPSQKVLAVFQPHLYSRTKDFCDDFAQALSKFDDLLLLDIYPARELPIPGVDSQWLFHKIALDSKRLTTKQQLVADVGESDADVIVMMGAGDIGFMVSDVEQMLIAKFNL